MCVAEAAFSASPWNQMSRVAETPSERILALPMFGSLARLKRGAEREEFFEFGRVVTDTVGPDDDYLPAFLYKGQTLGDSDDDAQPDRRRDVFAP
jgi:hypothetical protein